MHGGRANGHRHSIVVDTIIGVSCARAMQQEELDYFPVTRPHRIMQRGEPADVALIDEPVINGHDHKDSRIWACAGLGYCGQD